LFVIGLILFAAVLIGAISIPLIAGVTDTATPV
jgi:hypothetical protein